MNVITPDWPAPNWVNAFTTTREMGLSRRPYDKCNLAHHVGEDVVNVTLNRLRLQQKFNLNPTLTWLNQTHSDRVIELTRPHANYLDADGVWTRKAGLSCIVMTADCLPLLLCDTAGSLVAAIHCGWQGIAKGIIERAVEQIKPHAQGELLAWFGPAIGPRAFEVGKDVYDLFVEQDYAANQAFERLKRPGKWLADIYALAKIRLYQLGIDNIFGGEYCTYTDTKHFYSYRKEKITGRMATVITLSSSLRS